MEENNLENKRQDKNVKRRFNTRNLAMIGMLGAISAVLMLLNTAVPFVPTFIKIDLSELPIILGAFMMGPLSGLMIILVKIVLHLVMSGTDSMFVGEFANVVGSVSYMIPAVLIYKKIRTKKGAVLSMAVGTIVTSVISIISNTFFVFPAYAKVYGMPMDAIISMGTAVNPGIHDLFTMMLYSILPFNIFKFALVSIITFFVYKKIEKLVKSFK